MVVLPAVPEELAYWRKLLYGRGRANNLTMQLNEFLPLGWGLDAVYET